MSTSTRSSLTRKSSLAKSGSTDKATSKSSTTTTTTNPSSNTAAATKADATGSGNKQKMQYTKTKERIVDGMINAPYKALRFFNKIVE